MARVLLIDDTPQIAELLTFALRDRGYDVVSTGFTDSIGDLVRDERAEAVVLDCSVYEMTESLFDLVRGDPAKPTFRSSSSATCRRRRTVACAPGRPQTCSSSRSRLPAATSRAHWTSCSWPLAVGSRQRAVTPRAATKNRVKALPSVPDRAASEFTAS